MLKVLRQLIIINFKTFYRQPEIIFWAVVFPLILFLILGFAFDTKKELSSTIGVIQTATLAPDIQIWQKLAQPYQAAFGKKVSLNLLNYATEQQAIKALKQGKIALFVKTNAQDKLEYHFDPQNKQAQNDYLILENLRQANQPSQQPKVIELKAKGSRYIDFFLPGLIAFNIMSSCLWGIGWGLIEIRMKKYLKRLTATPMSRAMFILAQILTRLIISVCEVAILITFAYFTFGIKIEGSLWAFIYLIIIGNFAFSGIAVLIGSRTASSSTGNGLLNAIIMPMMLTSGIFFSYQNFPKAVIPIIRCFPLTILADSIRAVFIESAGFAEIFLPSTILIILAAVTFTIGLKIFKWY